MEINKKILRELIREVEGRQRNARKIYGDYLVVLKSAESVEELIKAKQDFMLELINNLPVVKEDDYFCLLNYDDARNQTCFDCSYGRKHGNCHIPRSDYSIMYEFINGLRHQIIHKFYRKGEKYE